MGRPRKPNSLKILEGDQPCRINPSEPRSPDGLGDPPEWLDDLGRSAWGRLAGRLAEMKLAKRADAEAAAIYCQAYSTWRKATVKVAAEGFSITTETTVKAHPLFPVIAEAQKTMLRILSQFGMTPSARAGLHVQDEPAEDPLIAFMANKPKAAHDGKRGRP